MTLDELHAQRQALMKRIVDEMAAERGLNLSEGLSPNDRHAIAFEAELAYEDWFLRVQDGEIITPSTPVEHLLAELFALDDEIHEVMEGGRKPDDTLQ